MERARDLPKRVVSVSKRRTITTEHRLSSNSGRRCNSACWFILCTLEVVQIGLKIKFNPEKKINYISWFIKDAFCHCWPFRIVMESCTPGSGLVPEYPFFGRDQCVVFWTSPQQTYIYTYDGGLNKSAESHLMILLLILHSHFHWTIICDPYLD